MIGRRPQLPSEAGVGLGAAVLVLVGVAGIGFTNPPATSLVGWLAIAPFLAAAFTPWRYVVGVGLLAAAITFLSALVDPEPLYPIPVARTVAMAVATSA